MREIKPSTFHFYYYAVPWSVTGKYQIIHQKTGFVGVRAHSDYLTEKSIDAKSPPSCQNSISIFRFTNRLLHIEFVLSLTPRSVSIPIEQLMFSVEERNDEKSMCNQIVEHFGQINWIN